MYTNNKISEIEMKTVIFTLASKIIKYFRINLIKMIKDLYCLMKETEEYTY